MVRPVGRHTRETGGRRLAEDVEIGDGWHRHAWMPITPRTPPSPSSPSTLEMTVTLLLHAAANGEAKDGRRTALSLDGSSSDTTTKAARNSRTDGNGGLDLTSWAAGCNRRGYVAGRTNNVDELIGELSRGISAQQYGFTSSRHTAPAKCPPPIGFYCSSLIHPIYGGGHPPAVPDLCRQASSGANRYEGAIQRLDSTSAMQTRSGSIIQIHRSCRCQRLRDTYGLGRGQSWACCAVHRRTSSLHVRARIYS